MRTDDIEVPERNLMIQIPVIIKINPPGGLVAQSASVTAAQSEEERVNQEEVWPRGDGAV